MHWAKGHSIMSPLGPSRRFRQLGYFRFGSKRTLISPSGGVSGKRGWRGPADEAGRALSRGRATARPSPQAVSAHSGHDHSAKNIGGHTARLLPSRKQSGLERLSRLHAAPWQPHQLISGRAPVAHTVFRLALFPVQSAYWSWCAEAVLGETAFLFRRLVTR